MKGRRLNRFMALSAVLAGLLAVGAGPAHAAWTLIDPVGRLLSIETAIDENDPARQGLVLVEHRLDGTTVRERIEGTFDDDALEISPVLAINPDDGQPVVVWSRQQGRGTDIAFTRRYADGYWTPVQLLTSSGRNHEPRIAVGTEGKLHVLWRGAGRGLPSFTFQTFELETGYAVGDPNHPLQPRGDRPDTSPGNNDDAGGGSDDPGVIGASRHCIGTEHGIMVNCDGVVVYQLSGCRLEIGTLEQDGTWSLTRVDTGSVEGDGSPVSAWQLVRTLGGSSCGQ